MKVACVGNMNNMLFVLCRYLRDAGIDCDLLMYNNEMVHFLPENDSFDEEYKSYTKVLEWGDIASFDTVSAEKIRSDLEEYDFTIVTQAPGFFYKAGIKIDVFFPAGGDFIITPFILENSSWVSKIRQIKLNKFIKSHTRAIQNSIIINQENYAKYFIKPLTKLDVMDRVYFFGAPLVYRLEYDKKEFLENSKYNEIRKENELLIVNQARQLWVSHSKSGHASKGSDVLIHGYASFLEKCDSDYKSKLVLFEYGEDVLKSKELINDLGIISNVIWLPIMSRKELMSVVKLADFACGEFHAGCIGGLTSWEALSVGTCLLHYLDSEVVLFENFTESYPFVNALNYEVIKETFVKFSENPNPFNDIGAQGKDWYINNFEKRSLNEWVHLIKIKEDKGVKGLIEYRNEKNI